MLLPSVLLLVFPLVLSANVPAAVPALNRCGAKATPETLRAAQILPQQFAANPAARAELHGSKEIEVWFHVFHKDATLAGGWVNDSIIHKQVEVLSKAYKPARFSFRLGGITRTLNERWWKGPTDEAMDRELRMATRRGSFSTSTANAATVFVMDLSDTGGTLGYATFPSAIGWINAATREIDGVVIQTRTMPGAGGLTGYNLGQTLTHEVGHWLGIFHTFQGGCPYPGDMVADTPAEAYPAFDCQVPRNTCAEPAGTPARLDPINNFMDYGYDYCMTEFTDGQVERMKMAWVVLRDPDAGSRKGVDM
ncbi:Metalloprotease [Geopyxis carbonaria]|nr:Metalloprotease [Geopyxis carbonaria]